MSEIAQMPPAALPFVRFANVLRANGFAVAPDQTQTFITAVGLLGPRQMDDIHKAALSTLAPPPERRDEFDALYKMVFLGQSLAAPSAEGAEDDELRAFDQHEGEREPPEIGDESDVGADATTSERLTARSFSLAEESQSLARFCRAAPAALPRQRSRRMAPDKKGKRPDIRRALREAVKRDGELIRLPVLGRKQRHRRILLLIDISGSMKELTDGHLRFAHTLAQCAGQLEVFTLGTRLTRVSAALKLRRREQSLDTASAVVSDWDGGTRLGDALDAFLTIPRFVGFARGSLTVILSDGLERGEASTLTAAMERLSKLAWSILWLTPLAEGKDFSPQTEALAEVAKFVDRFDSSRDVGAVCAAVLAHARSAA